MYQNVGRQKNYWWHVTDCILVFAMCRTLCRWRQSAILNHLKVKHRRVLTAAETSLTHSLMTRRQLWSVATALHDVHVSLHSATSIFSWLLFRRQSAASMSFEGDQEVFASSYLSSGQISLPWLRAAETNEQQYTVLGAYSCRESTGKLLLLLLGDINVWVTDSFQRHRDVLSP